VSSDVCFEPGELVVPDVPGENTEPPDKPN